MKVKRSKGERIFGVFNYAFLSLIMVICLYPVWYVAVASFSDSNQLMQHSGPLLSPLGFSIDAYKKVFQNPMIAKGYMNTLFILVVGVVLDLIMTSLGAYFLSRKNVMFKRGIMMLIVFTMFFSGGLVPLYMTVSSLGLISTKWILIIFLAVSTYNLIIARTFIQTSIPEDLYEAAVLDGCSHFTYFVKVVLPLSKAVIAVLILYYAVYHWNDYFNALIFNSNSDNAPLQIVLREILLLNQAFASGSGSMAGGFSQSSADQVKYAVIIVSTVPILCVYPFIQKYFEKGVMIGAVKG